MPVPQIKIVKSELTLSNSRDYSRTYQTENMIVGACEFQGERDTQQDCLAVSELFNFNQLSKDQQELIFDETFKIMQAQYGKKKQGTTGCVATAWLHNENNQTYFKAVTANVGDSATYFVILDANGKIKENGRINKLHNSQNELELERVERAGGCFTYGRLNKELAVSRALGDNKLDQLGLSHDCEVEFESKPLNSGEKAFMVVACDGLDTLDSDHISRIVQKYHVDVTNTAYILVNAALNANSTDNISALVFAVTNTPTSGAVFDGHGPARSRSEPVTDYFGGNVIAQNIGRDFYPELHKNFDMVLAGQENELKEINTKRRIELAAAKEQKRQAKLAEIQRQQQNIILLKEKIDAYLPNLPSSKFVHIFTEIHDDAYTRMCSLVFTTNERNKLMSLIKTMGEATQLEKSSYTSDHPTTYQFSIHLQGTTSELSVEFIEFIMQLQKLNEVKKSAEDKSTEEKLKVLADFKKTILNPSAHVFFANADSSTAKGKEPQATKTVGSP